MMRRTVCLVFLVAIVAGCSVKDDGLADASPPDALVPRATATRLSPCDILEALIDVPETRVTQHVPPGFSLRATNGMVAVVLGAATCTQGSRAFLAIPVTPEDERLRAEGVRHFFEPEHLVVAGEAFARELDALRGSATNATRIEGSAGPPQPSFIVEDAGGWAHRAAGLGGAVAPADIAGGVFREWFPARGGYGYLEAAFGTEGASLGVVPALVETGEGTIARDVIGAEATGGMFVFDGSGYADATLGFVPYP